MSSQFGGAFGVRHDILIAFQGFRSAEYCVTGGKQEDTTASTTAKDSAESKRSEEGGEERSLPSPRGPLQQDQHNEWCY